MRVALIHLTPILFLATVLGTDSKTESVARRDRIFKRLAGAYTCLETPVPIPNTAVKQTGPMIVETRK